MDTEPDKHCEGCGSKRFCHSIYQRLGHAKGPSVTQMVLVALGIPILVFIVTLAVAGAWLGGLGEGSRWPIPLAFLIAVGVTAIAVLAIRKTIQRPVDQRDPPNPESTR